MPQTSPRQVATTIWAALLAAPVLLLGIAIHVAGLRNGVAIASRASGGAALVQGAFVLSAFQVALSWLWAVRIAPSASGAAPGRGAFGFPPGPEAHAIARLVVACALCEGGALAAAFVLLLTGSQFALAPFALSWLALAAHFPGERHWAQLATVPNPDTRSPRGAIEAETAGMHLSQLDKSYVVDCRGAVVVGVLGFLVFQCIAFREASRDALGSAVLELMAGVPLAMAAVSISKLSRRGLRVIAFDEEGLWLVPAGKERGLVPWSGIARVREGSFRCCMRLQRETGKELMTVEYQRDHFLELRRRVVEGMSFRPPALPRVFRPRIASRILLATGAGLMAGLGGFLLWSAHESGGVPMSVGYAFGALMSFVGGFLAWLSVVPPKVVVADDHLVLRGRRYAYRDVASLSMSFERRRGQMRPHIWLTLNNRKQLLIPNWGCDSVTFQRTLEWAMGRGRGQNQAA